MPATTQAATGDTTVSAAHATVRQNMAVPAGLNRSTLSLRIDGMPRVLVWMRQFAGPNPAGYQVEVSASSIIGGVVPANEWMPLQAFTPMPVVPLPGNPVILIYNGLVGRLLRVSFTTSPLNPAGTDLQILLGSAQ